MVIDTNFFDEPAYSTEYPKDFALIENDIKVLHPELYTRSNSVKDMRFDDTSWSRLHACALRNLTLWVIKPIDSKLERAIQHSIFCVVSPIAISFDVIANTALVVPRLTVMAMSVVVRAVKSVALWKWDSTDIFGVIENKNTWLLLHATGNSYGDIFKTISNIFFLNLQLFVNIGPKLSSRYQWSYWVYNMDKSTHFIPYSHLPGKDKVNPENPELILDQKKVKFLRDKYGWQISDKEFLSYNVPYNQYHSQAAELRQERIRLNYSLEKERPHIISQWTEWLYSHSVGNIHYYKPCVRSCNSEKKL